MITLAQLALIMTLVPLVAGILLAALGARLPRRVALPVAIVAVVIAFVAALLLAADAVPGIPQLITVISFGSVGLVHRLDNFTAYAIIGVTAWIAPVLLWMTTPRGAALQVHTHSTRPQGFALMAVALLLSAVMLDNVLLIVLCWAGIGLLAWLIARPETAFRPSSPQEWLDLALLALGPILFGLTMLFPMVSGKSTSVYELTGRNVANFAQGALIILALAFAAGMYPFILWVRRVAQGVLPEASGILLLASLPLGIVMLARVAPILAPNGVWPTWRLGPATIPLNALPLLLGIITIVICGLVLLFESDLVVITSTLAVLVLGWCFTAFGTGDNRALLGVTLLLLAYVLGVGALLAVCASLEWAERELTAESVDGMAFALPAHFIAVVLGGLTLLGIPFLVGFAGMATIDQGIISEGGTAALGGALIWIGNAIGLLAFVRLIGRMLHRPIATDAAEGALPGMPESLALLVPAVLLIIFGVAPEIALIGKSIASGPAVTAANALLTSGLTIPGISASALGFSVAHTLWLPGLFWALAVVAIIIVVLSAGLIGPDADPTPVFVGGEPYGEETREPIDSWQDLATLVRAPWVLPGPASWRNDIGDLDDWDEDAADGDEEDLADADENELVESELVAEEDVVVIADNAPEDDAAENAATAENGVAGAANGHEQAPRAPSQPPRKNKNNKGGARG